MRQIPWFIRRSATRIYCPKVWIVNVGQLYTLEKSQTFMYTSDLVVNYYVDSAEFYRVFHQKYSPSVSSDDSIPVAANKFLFFLSFFLFLSTPATAAPNTFHPRFLSHESHQYSQVYIYIYIYYIYTLSYSGSKLSIDSWHTKMMDRPNFGSYTFRSFSTPRNTIASIVDTTGQTR